MTPSPCYLYAWKMTYDLFLLSHGEPMADLHWRALVQRAPHARRVDGINGILAAHQHCATLARTSHFFVVDADNEITDIDFSIKLPDYDKRYVHVWRARNPLNGLVYGWGGIKLFPRKLLLQQQVMPLDMTGSFPLKLVPIVGSITHFNTSPFATWRSAFRECVKLVRSPTDESRERLAVWCDVARGPYAEWCLLGARDGREYGITHHDQPDMLSKINDWLWLEQRFKDHAGF